MTFHLLNWITVAPINFSLLKIIKPFFSQRMQIVFKGRKQLFYIDGVATLLNSFCYIILLLLPSLKLQLRRAASVTGSDIISYQVDNPKSQSYVIVISTEHKKTWTQKLNLILSLSQLTGKCTECSKQHHHWVEQQKRQI